MANQPTSRQIRGQFDALRATRSFAVSETINISSGNYGAGKVFGGATEVSHASWASATDTFYVYLDQNDQLVLNDITSFPDLSTRIARVVIASGVIIDIIDERPSINSIIDGYQVLFDDSTSTVATGPSVQDALEALDAYVASVTGTGQDVSKFVDIDITGGVQNGLVDIGFVGDTAALLFSKQPSGAGTTKHNFSLPNDYVSGTDITVRVFWSPDTASAGNVRWQLKYNGFVSSTDNVDAAATSVALNQASPGIANRLVDTGSSLLIPSAAIGSANIVAIGIERDFSAADTYSGTARLHLVRIEYTGRGVT